VLFTAVSAVCTAAWALNTAAWAEARLLGDGMAVVVVVFVVPVVLPAPEPEPPLLEGDDRVVLGTTTVTVTLGVVFVTLVPDLVVEVPDPRFPGEAPGVVVPGWYAAYSMVWAGAL
jgi:hypothetical protein